jgi:hypothetical protein
LGLVAVGVVISDPMESLVALYYLPRDFLFLGVRSVALRGGFELTTTNKLWDVGDLVDLWEAEEMAEKAA